MAQRERQAETGGGGSEDAVAGAAVGGVIASIDCPTGDRCNHRQHDWVNAFTLRDRRTRAHARHRPRGHAWTQLGM